MIYGFKVPQVYISLPVFVKNGEFGDKSVMIEANYWR